MAKSSKKEQKATIESAIEYVPAFCQPNWVELPPASVPSGNEITCSFWAYGGELLPNWNSVIEVVDANNQRLLNIHLPWDNSTIFFDCGNNGSGFDQIKKQAQPKDYKGKWSHWAFTKNATTGEMKIYLNGELWHSGTGKTFPIPQTAAKVLLGCSYHWHHYPGKLVQVQLWNRERTQAEIQQDMPRRLRGDEPGLVSYWPLNEGSGNIAYDKTSNANHGTIHGNLIWEPTLSLIDATDSQSEDEEASSSPETSTPQSNTPIMIEISPAVSLHTGSKIKLKSWKGDYLHRPDSAQGVTTWDTGVGNEWTVEAIADNKIKLKSWKGDYLHRPDSAQGVTTWNTGVGNEWTVEAILSETAKPNADNKIKLKSYKGDYLHRPDSPPDVTTWSTGVGNEWELEVISIQQPSTSSTDRAILGANDIIEQLGEPATAPPNVSPMPPAPTEAAELLLPAIAQPIPPVVLSSRQTVLALGENHQGIAVGGGGLKPQGRFTIEAWVYPATDAGKQVIYAEGEALFYLEGGELKFQTHSGKAAIASVGTGLTSGNWYHVAVVRAGSRPGDTRLYINAAQNDNQMAISPVLTFDNSYLGGQPDVPDSRFQGKLLEMRVWRFARSQAEIQANMTYFLTGRELGLVRCWSLNEGFGTAIGSRTTDRAVATLTGDITWEESEIPIKINLNAEERLTRSTGLEDYGYWFKEMAKQQKTEADPPFRRGRIWA